MKRLLETHLHDELLESFWLRAHCASWCAALSPQMAEEDFNVVDASMQEGKDVRVRESKRRSNLSHATSPLFATLHLAVGACRQNCGRQVVPHVPGPQQMPN